MEKLQYDKELRELLKQAAKVDVFSVGMDDDLIIFFGLDSLTGLRFLAAVEKRFNVRFPDARLAEFRSLNQVANFLLNYPSEKT